MLKLIITMFISLNCLFSICSAEQVYLEVEGQHILSKEETWTQAEDYAVNNALKQAIEKVGVRIDSYTEVQNKTLVYDTVKRIASAIVIIQDKKIQPNFTDSTFTIRAFVKCIVNTDNLNKITFNARTSNNNSLVWSNNDFNKAKNILKNMKGK